jgi:hypothetical protein
MNISEVVSNKENNMYHTAISQVLQRAEQAKTDSDFTYFFSLLLAGEALTKTIVLGMVAAIADDKDRHRYRLEHQLARADGIGDWAKSLEDALIGPASQFLLSEARVEQTELTRLCVRGDWQHDATTALLSALTELEIDSESVPVKSDMKRWFRLFATLRNKTRGHGATMPEKASRASGSLFDSIKCIYENFNMFNRPWAHLHRNLNGKYRISYISEKSSDFDPLKQSADHSYPNGIHIIWGKPRAISLMRTDAELKDFFFANGGLNSKRFELLSYYTDDRVDGDASSYIAYPGTLPSSETHGHNELLNQGQCFSNVPDSLRDYVQRPALESELRSLLMDDKRPIVTLVGRGGIGKTSLAVQVIKSILDASRYEAIVWFSARDIDLQLSGPKPVRPAVVSPDDMGAYYARLVLKPEEIARKGFNARQWFEMQLQKCDLGPCLFVFDNFETTQNPVEVFAWIDTFVRLPNKVLITTRLRDFKGDYPLEVRGMNDQEARQLISQVSLSLGVASYLNDQFISDLISKSEGHPYIIRVLLGEVVKTKKAIGVPQLVAGTGDILTALFERTYASLSPCAQRAFLALSGWQSAVPKLALEAVLFRSTEERHEVEVGIESLINYSLAELHTAPSDRQEYIGLPLMASLFGRKKLAISTYKAAIQADVEILQMLGPSRRNDVHLGLARNLENFIVNVSRRIEKGASYEMFRPVLEAICRVYNPGWLLLARWHIEQGTDDGFRFAKEELHRFLENDPPKQLAGDAWHLLSKACYYTNDAIGDIHASIERAQVSGVPFHELSSIANRLNSFLKSQGMGFDKDQKRYLADKLAAVLNDRKDEALASDLSRMAWLSIHLGQESAAREYVSMGLGMEPHNYHLIKLAQRLGVVQK